ncbi:hypothetical protein ACG33_12345 [Steroidobacter denitrificans]|uniref:Uncharacterized protein n=1 Tax=Steroidobacter denitrificans TaxID=465721 RepID=A0A127FBT5_STEDE|nr:hypothetical protein [Steroidobacter denitrificans]AMN47874.1 hypothetical protein ACG33_12345 [Steroidobacter denitrificans]
MAVPWLQIVQLVPSIVEVSRDLLKSARRMPAATTAAELAQLQGEDALLARLQALEENERRQAELISQMAQQLDGLTRAATALHRRVIWLTAGLAIALLLGLSALFPGLR